VLVVLGFLGLMAASSIEPFAQSWVLVLSLLLLPIGFALWSPLGMTRLRARSGSGPASAWLDVSFAVAAQAASRPRAWAVGELAFGGEDRDGEVGLGAQVHAFVGEGEVADDVGVEVSSGPWLPGLMVGIGVIIVIQDHFSLFEPVHVISRVVERLRGFGGRGQPGVGRRCGIDRDLLFQEVGLRNVVAGIGSLRSHPVSPLLIGTGSDRVLSQHATSGI
jgi:hypothetical protein